MINELKLLKGESYKVSDYITIKHPTLLDIYEYGEDNYNSIIDIFCAKPYDYMVDLEENGIDFQSVDSYELFLMRFYYDGYKDGLKWLLNLDIPLLKYENLETHEIVLGDESQNIIIDRGLFLIIRLFLMEINGLTEKNEFNLASDASPLAKKMILDEKKREMKKAKKRKKPWESQLANYISALAWNNDVGINMTNIWEMPIYVFYQGLQRKRQGDSFKNIMQGIYAGTIDSKNLDMETIDWTARIK